MKITFYDATGKESAKVDASPLLFEAKVNADLMHRAVVMRLANRRNPIAHTKTRAEVAATTKKAFKQKGTGNARRGALSTNLLRGGGVTHGPRNNRNFTLAMPKKERRAALFSCLTVRANENAILGLTELGVKTPSTKQAVATLANLPIGKKVLMVVTSESQVEMKSLKNLPNVRVLRSQYLNPVDILWADHVCFLGEALKYAEKNFTPKA